MIAVRLVQDGKAADEVTLIPNYRARVLLESGRAIPANGHVPEPEAEELPHIDENLDVHGLTDRDPEFFERQAAEERAFKPPKDRMYRGGVKKRHGKPIEGP